MREPRRGSGGLGDVAKGVALALLGLFGALLLTPVVAALGDDETSCCTRGRCCHARLLSDAGLCLYASCRCGGHDGAAGAPMTFDPALPPTETNLVADVTGDGPLAAVLPSPLTRSTDPTTPPPRRLRSPV